MSVLIVDDHPATRQGLATIVRDAFRVERVIEVDGARAALLAARRDSPALILLDLRMPGGIDTSVLVTQLRLAAPTARIAIITAYEDADLIQRCFAPGAVGCLLKGTTVLDMRTALQAIARGHRVIDPRIAQTLANAHVTALRGNGTPINLTHREREEKLSAHSRLLAVINANAHGLIGVTTRGPLARPPRVKRRLLPEG